MKNLNSTNKHGGKRQRAGKPALYGKAMIRKNVMLDPETIEILKALGGGNLSEGIRKAAEQSAHKTCSTCGGENGKHELDCRVAHNMLSETAKRR